MLTKVKNFFSEVKVELQKASWPWEPKEKGIRRYKELTDSTLVVIIAMLLLGGYVALFDLVLVNVVHYFTKLHLLWHRHSQRKINGLWFMPSPDRKTRCVITSPNGSR